MNIYLVESDYSLGYDTYDSFVCVAENSMDAAHIHPDVLNRWSSDKQKWVCRNDGTNCSGEWVLPSEVTVTLVGTTKFLKEGHIICASFNAG